MNRFDFESRLQRARAAMQSAGIEVLLLSIGSDLPYLTGYRALESERLTMAVVPREGEVIIVVPELEAPLVPSGLEVRIWSDSEDAVELVADLCRGSIAAGIGDQTWAAFLLRLQAALPQTRFEAAGSLISRLRLRKDPAEIESLGLAAAAADRVVAELRGMRFSGMTEAQLAQVIARLALEQGHESAGFAIAAAGPNGASPHHEPGDRVIEGGDAVVVDFGGTVRGYHSDTSRTFHVGQPSAEYSAAFELLVEAQWAAVEAVKPGVPAEHIDRTARDIIAAGGYGDHFIHRTGHGIGLDVHEEPYLVQGNTQPLEAGMAFSVEPGIYLPGEWGMRIEDIVAVTAEGARPLNNSPRTLAIVE